jgi:hypothetical protein
MSVNYVIATYNGKCNRTHKEPLPKDVLIEHLKKIYSLQHKLNQITIVKPYSENYYSNYYDIDDIISKFTIPVVIIECENYGYSPGQWLYSFESSDIKFDYYVFVEDDYCPGMNEFDSILLNCYKQTFNDNIGVLCSLVQGNSINNGSYPIHFEGGLFISCQTLEKLYSTEKFEGDPRKYLNLLENYKPLKNDKFNWEHQRNGYIGGYYQITFSHLFTLIDIKHEDYLNTPYNTFTLQFPYWADTKNEKGGEIVFYNKGDIVKNNYTIGDIIRSPIIPVQLKDVSSIKYNLNI